MHGLTARDELFSLNITSIVKTFSIHRCNTESKRIAATPLLCYGLEVAGACVADAFRQHQGFQLDYAD